MADGELCACADVNLPLSEIDVPTSQQPHVTGSTDHVGAIRPDEPPERSCNLPRGAAATDGAKLRLVGRLQRDSLCFQHCSMARTTAKALVITVVIAVSLCVAAVGWRTWRTPLRQLHAACRTAGLPLEGRLSGFPPPAARANSTSAAAQVKFAAVEVIERTVDRHEIGVAELVLGRPAAAVDNIQRAARLTSCPACSSDLAVAYLAAADSERNPHRVTEALAAVDTALRLTPELPEALFNRAVVLEKLPLHGQAITAWIRYLRIDSRSAWADEARRRLQRLRSNSGRHRWEHLAAAFDTQDGSAETLRNAVRLYPEEARRRTETKLLAGWATAELSSEHVSAKRWLVMGRTVASALLTENGDGLLTDAIAAIELANGSRRFELARAHQLYDNGRRAYGERRVSDALQLFRKAAVKFRIGRSPMALVADYYAASCLDDASDAAAADEVRQLLAATPQRYGSLRAQLLWLGGTISVRRGNAIDGLNAYKDALDLFERLREIDSATRMRNALAAVNTVIGRGAEAQRLRYEAFQSLSETGDARALQAALELAGRAEAVEQHWSEALSLFALARDESLRVNPRVHISALLWSALVAHRLAQSAAGLALLEDARRYINDLADAALRKTAKDDLLFIEGSIRRKYEPGRAAALLAAYVQSAIAHDRTTFLPEAYLEQARAVRATGNHSTAAALYDRAIRAIDVRRSGATRSGIIDAYFGTSDAAARELVDLLASRGLVKQAFSVLDRSRGRTLAELNGDTTVEDPLNQWPAHTVAVAYLAMDDKLLIFTLDSRSGASLHAVAIRETVLQATSVQFARALRSGDERQAWRLGAQLHRWLIGPIESRIADARALLVVPDNRLATIPFAALRNHDGAYLVERVSIAYAPSVALVVGARDERSALPGVLVIADPDFDRKEFPLPPLPGARSEATRVGREHAEAKFLVGKNATPRQVMDAISENGIVHVAAHAVVVPDDPMRSFLLLARDGSASGLLYANEIVSRRIDSRVVVLAACRSAASPAARGDVSTLALAFLAAGANNVVGSLWDLDDRSAPDVAAAFHRRLAAGIAPAEALRQAQVESVGRKPLATWSAFILSTAGPLSDSVPAVNSGSRVPHINKKKRQGDAS
jgi:CHAT domain-containing protein